VKSRRNWLGSRRAEAAADHILDAAGELFAQNDVGNVGMNDIARAAGCSRPTLYRYFENRDAVYAAYISRGGHLTYRRVMEAIDWISDPRERLLAGLVTVLRVARQDPVVMSFYCSTMGSDFIERSEAVHELVTSFLSSVESDDPEAIGRRAQWLVRVLASLLLHPAHDDHAERAMLEEFVLPVIYPVVQVPLRD
jgi:AcrR family transcriptional regulator